ncbi:MAG: hypothetical protein ACTHLH_02290 [Solirubrobacterales bacterium]
MSEPPPNSTPPPGARPEPNPLQRRLLLAASVLSLLLILVVANSLLNGGSNSPFNPNPVAAAAERTAESPGMRIDMTMSMDPGTGSPVTITGKGAYNGETNLTEVTYEMTKPQGEPLEADAVMSESAWYFRFPQFPGKVPEGKEWMKFEGFPGQEEMGTPGMNPGESLQMLRGSGTVQRLGHAEIGHVRTTRYRVEKTSSEIIDSLRSEGKDELAEQAERVSSQIVGPVHYEVFIAPDGMLRRMRMEMTMSVNGRTVTSNMRMDFFDFGVKPEIQLPDDSRAYDMTQLLEERMDAVGEAG